MRDSGWFQHPQQRGSKVISPETPPIVVNLDLTRCGSASIRRVREATSGTEWTSQNCRRRKKRLRRFDLTFEHSQYYLHARPYPCEWTCNDSLKAAHTEWRGRWAKSAEMNWIGGSTSSRQVYSNFTHRLVCTYVSCECPAHRVLEIVYAPTTAVIVCSLRQSETLFQCFILLLYPSQSVCHHWKLAQGRAEKCQINIHDWLEGWTQKVPLDETADLPFRSCNRSWLEHQV